MNSINQVFVSSELSIVAVHISLQFLCYDSQFKSYKQFLMMMTPVWRMLQMPDIHLPSPSPDRQGSVCVWSCSHVLCLCLASWGSCQPIRGQEGDSLTNQRPGQCWPWHGCCDEGRGGDSVPVSGMEYKIQNYIELSIGGMQTADSCQMRKTVWKGCRGWTPPVNTGRNIQLSVKFIPLVQDCSCGVTHTQRLLGSLFVHSEHFAKLDRNENVYLVIIIRIPEI